MLEATPYDRIDDYRSVGKHGAALEIVLDDPGVYEGDRSIYQEHFLGRAADSRPEWSACLFWDAGQQAINNWENCPEGDTSSPLFSAERTDAFLKFIENRGDDPGHRQHRLATAAIAVCNATWTLDGTKVLNEASITNNREDLSKVFDAIAGAVNSYRQFWDLEATEQRLEENVRDRAITNAAKLTEITPASLVESLAIAWLGPSSEWTRTNRVALAMVSAGIEWLLGYTPEPAHQNETHVLLVHKTDTGYLGSFAKLHIDYFEDTPWNTHFPHPVQLGLMGIGEQFRRGVDTAYDVSGCSESPLATCSWHLKFTSEETIAQLQEAGWDDLKKEALHRPSGIDGASASGSFAVGFAAVREQDKLDSRVVMTSEVLADGSLSPITSLQSKIDITLWTRLLRDRADFLVLVPSQLDQDGEWATGMVETLKVERDNFHSENASDVEAALGWFTGRTKALRIYLEEIIQRAERIPFGLFPEGYKLENIRVQVRAATYEPEHQARVTESERRAGGRYDHRLADLDNGKENPPRDWEEVRGTVKRALILGDPGMGKSWLLRWEARRRAAEALEELDATGSLSDKPLPVWITFNQLGNYLQKCTEDNQEKHDPQTERISLAKGISQAVILDSRDSSINKRVRETVRSAIALGKYTLLVDSYDEASETEGRCAEKLIDEGIQHSPPVQLIETSRMVSRPLSMDGRQELQLLPFTRPQREQLIDNYFHRQPDRGRLLKQGLIQPHLQGLAQVPVLLTFLCKYVYDSPKMTAAELCNVSRPHLYDHIIQSLIEDAWKVDERVHAASNGLYLSVDRFMRCLCSMAFELFATSTSRTTFDADLIEKAATSAGLPLDIRDRFTSTLIERSGVLAKVRGGSRAHYEFLHLSILEYLVAVKIHQLMSLGDSRAKELFARYWNHPTWAPIWDFVSDIAGENCASGVNVVDEMIQSTEENIHPYDKLVHRPQVMALRWSIFARLGNGKTAITSDIVNRLGQLAIDDEQFDRLFGDPSIIGLKLPPKLIDKCIEHLRTCIGHKISKTIVRVLMHHSFDQAVFDVLFSIIRDQSLGEHVRTQAAIALSPSAQEHYQQEKLLEYLQGKGRSTFEQSMALRILASASAEERVQEAVLRILSDTSLGCSARVQAANTLAGICEKSEVSVSFLSLIGRSGDVESVPVTPTVQWPSVVGRTKVADLLLSLLCDSNTETELLNAVSNCLSQITSDQSIQDSVVGILLEEENPRGVRLAAARALRVARLSADNQKALLRALRNTQDLGIIRAQYVIRLAKYVHQTEVAQAFLELLTDPNEGFVVKSVAATWIFPVASALPVCQALIDLLRDGNLQPKTSDVKYQALMSLQGAAKILPRDLVLKQLGSQIHVKQHENCAQSGKSRLQKQDASRKLLIAIAADKKSNWLLRRVVIEWLEEELHFDYVQDTLLGIATDRSDEDTLRGHAIRSLQPQAQLKKVWKALLAIISDPSCERSARRTADAALLVLGRTLRDDTLRKCVFELFGSTKPTRYVASLLRGILSCEIELSVNEIGVVYEALEAHTPDSGNRRLSWRWAAMRMLAKETWRLRRSQQPNS
ncbi:MAG: hypothetical protein AAGB04_01430 [Pseudomonadota bacterium]